MEYKELFLKDLCARVPYQPKGRVVNKTTGAACEEWLTCATFSMFTSATNNSRLYLRQLSDMTEEEKEELSHKLPRYWSINIIDKLNYLSFDTCDSTFIDIEILLDIVDWLYKKHFDFLGLIESGFAIAVAEENNPYKV